MKQKTKAPKSKGFYFTLWSFVFLLLVAGVGYATTISDSTSTLTGDLDLEQNAISDASSINNIYYVQAGNASDIQAKIDMCNNECSVIIPQGFYTLSNPLSINGTKISLEGKGFPILDFSTGSGHGIIANQDKLEDFTISGLFINGTTSSGIIIQPTNPAKNIIIKNNIVKNSGGQGINVQGRDLLVDGNIVEDVNSEFGIVLGGYVDRVKIVGNSINNTGQGGIQWGYSGKNVVIDGNTVSYSGNGIEIGAINTSSTEIFTKNIIISNNVLESTTTGILALKKVSGPVSHTFSNVLIESNVIVQSTRGIRYGNVTNLKISNNLINRSSTLLITDDGDSVNAIVDNNFLINSGSQGVAIASDGTIVKNNFIKNVTFDAIVINAGASGVVSKNNDFYEIGRDYFRNKDSNDQFIDYRTGVSQMYDCGTDTLGAMWYNQTAKILYVCNSTDFSAV